MCRMDLMVSKKEKTDWRKVSGTDVGHDEPSSSLHDKAQTQASDSPPLGRPGHREGGGQIGTKKRIRSRQSSGSSPTTKASRKECDKSHFLGTSGDESDRQNMSNVTLRKNQSSALYCGPSTISPVKEGQGLLATPSRGKVTEVTGSAQGELICESA